MRIYRKFLVLFVVIAALATSSCRKMFEMNQPIEDKTEYSSIYPMGGEWYVTYQFEHPDGVSGIGDWYGVGHVPLFTYNTADESTTEMWINDDGNFWETKFKVPINLNSLTFGSNDSIQSSFDYGDYDVKVLVKNGKIIKNGGKSPSGVASDSIYFEISYGDDDPGVFYQVSGIRRTGFLEDEY